MQDELMSEGQKPAPEQPFVGPSSQEDPSAPHVGPPPGSGPAAEPGSAPQPPGPPQAPQVPPAQPGAAAGAETWPQYSYPYQYQYQWPYTYGQQPTPTPKKSRTALIIVVVLCGLVLLGGLMIAAISMSSGGIATLASDSIAIVRIQGIIAESTGGGPFGFGYESGTETIVNQLERAGTDASVKAVVIRINSPGGSAAASQEIYRAVKRVREKHGKPVVVSMGDVAASGGYYVAAPADHIVANPATLTGSIGVLMQTINLEALMERYGIHADTVKSGAYKDTGSMWRKMSPEERTYWQGMVDDVYDQFVQAVVAGRKMEEADVKKLADGRVFTGKQAKDNNLVDELGGLRTAIEAAKKLAGIKGRVQIKELRRKSFFEEFMGPSYRTKGDVVRRILEYERANPARHLLETPLPYVE